MNVRTRIWTKIPEGPELADFVEKLAGAATSVYY